MDGKLLSSWCVYVRVRGRGGDEGMCFFHPVLGLCKKYVNNGGFHELRKQTKQFSLHNIDVRVQ